MTPKLYKFGSLWLCHTSKKVIDVFAFNGADVGVTDPVVPYEHLCRYTYIPEEAWVETTGREQLRGTALNLAIQILKQANDAGVTP